MSNETASDKEARLQSAIEDAASKIYQGLLANGVAGSERKIHELVQEVTKDLEFSWDDDVLLRLYQKQFVVQAALCELYYRCASDESPIELCFTPISVYTVEKHYGKPFIDGAPRSVESNEITETGQSDYTPNSAFYLNFDNFFSATPGRVSELLTSFWQSYDAFMNRDPALAALGLEQHADWQAIQSRYRKLAKQHHPDKGGDRQEFIKIRQAFESLKRLR